MSGAQLQWVVESSAFGAFRTFRHETKQYYITFHYPQTCDQQVASSTADRALPSFSIWMGDRLWVGKQSRHVTDHPSQLNLPSLRDR